MRFAGAPIARYAVLSGAVLLCGVWTLAKSKELSLG